jgi:hypothetical protein
MHFYFYAIEREAYCYWYCSDLEAEILYNDKLLCLRICTKGWMSCREVAAFKQFKSTNTFDNCAVFKNKVICAEGKESNAIYSE